MICVITDFYKKVNDELILIDENHLLPRIETNNGLYLYNYTRKYFMKLKTIKNITFSISLSALLAVPATTMAETFSGKLNGHGCAHKGMTCPVDRLDPHLALESDFVLQKKDGDYYFLKMPRSTKARHALEQVMVDGKLDKKYHSIDVNEFKVKTGDGYKVVWSKALQAQELDSLHNSEKYSAPIFLN